METFSFLLDGNGITADVHFSLPYGDGVPDDLRFIFIPGVEEHQQSAVFTENGAVTGALYLIVCGEDRCIPFLPAAAVERIVADQFQKCDAVIFAPEPLGLIAVDSKFPLEHYQLMVDKNRSQLERQLSEKQFKTDVKKHIDAIGSKYIIPSVTSHQAIMFLPAEAIFAEINAYHSDLVEYAYQKNVWITSPTTLISTLTTIQVLLKNIERDKYAKVVHEELTKLGIEFGRYRERWNKLSKSIETVSKDAEILNITTDKITKKFAAISDVNLDEKEYLE